MILEQCQLCGKDDNMPTDAKLAAVLRSCAETLRWYVESSIFGAECWDVLAMKNACPNFEVLWVDIPIDWIGTASGWSRYHPLSFEQSRQQAQAVHDQSG